MTVVRSRPPRIGPLLPTHASEHHEGTRLWGRRRPQGARADRESPLPRSRSIHLCSHEVRSILPLTVARSRRANGFPSTDMLMSTEPAESRPTTNPRGAADRQRLIWQVGLALVVVGILVFNAWSEARKARVQEEEKIAAAEHKAAEKARKAEEKAEAARRKDEAGTKSRSTPAKVDAPKSHGSKSKKPADEDNVVTASPEKPVDDAPVAEAPPKPRDNPAGSEVAAKPSEPRGPPTTGSAKSAPTPRRLPRPPRPPEVRRHPQDKGRSTHSVPQRHVEEPGRTGHLLGRYRCRPHARSDRPG